MGIFLSNFDPRVQLDVKHTHTLHINSCTLTMKNKITQKSLVNFTSNYNRQITTELNIK